MLGNFGQLGESNPNPPLRYKRQGNPNSVAPFNAFRHAPENKARFQQLCAAQQLPADAKNMAVVAGEEWKELSDLEKERWAVRAREIAATNGAGPMSSNKRCRSREGLCASLHPACSTVREPCIAIWG